MSTKDTGGPAFPAPDAGDEHFSQRSAYMGMTLRDYFAAQAMNSLISMLPWATNPEDGKPPVIAANAYTMADAMLKARNE